MQGRTEELETLAVEMYARKLSTRDIEAVFADAAGRSLLSRTAVSEITERLWAEYEMFATRDLSEFEITYLFLDGTAERLWASRGWRCWRPGGSLDRRQTAHRARLSPEIHDRSGKRQSAAERRSGLASVEHVDEKIRHLSVHRGHSLDSSNGHDALVDISAAKQMTFTGTREALRERLAQLEARGATGIIFGTSGYDVERELRAYAEVAGLR
jgi:hypothetical protein